MTGTKQWEKTALDERPLYASRIGNGTIDSRFGYTLSANTAAKQTALRRVDGVMKLKECDDRV